MEVYRGLLYYFVEEEINCKRRFIREMLTKLPLNQYVIAMSETKKQ